MSVKTGSEFEMKPTDKTVVTCANGRPHPHTKYCDPPHRLVSDVPAHADDCCMQHPFLAHKSCSAWCIFCVACYKPQTDSINVSAASEPQAVPPPLTVDECLRDLQAWIEFALKGEIKGRQTGDYATGFNCYSYVEIPEWSLRQKLNNITTALTRTTTADALAEALRGAVHALESYKLGNASPELADEVCAAAAAALAQWEGKGQGI